MMRRKRRDDSAQSRLETAESEASLTDEPDDIAAVWAAAEHAFDHGTLTLEQLFDAANHSQIPSHLRVKFDAFIEGFRQRPPAEVERRDLNAKARQRENMEAAKLSARLRQPDRIESYGDLLAEYANRAGVSSRTLERRLVAPGIRRRDSKK